MSDVEADKHGPIKGSCLCDALKYTIAFPANSAWPPTRHSCQCIQCRRQTGALVVPFISVSPSQFNITSTASPSPLKEYQSSTDCYRAFCAICGSSLYWRSNQTHDEIEIMTGTLDQEFMQGETGRILCTPADGRYWCKDTIKGVTDVGDWPKFEEGSGSRKLN